MHPAAVTRRAPSFEDPYKRFLKELTRVDSINRHATPLAFRRDTRGGRWHILYPRYVFAAMVRIRVCPKVYRLLADPNIPELFRRPRYIRLGEDLE